MPIQVLMPQLGESVLEGTLTKWLKRSGESVEEFEPLLEINTDKVDTEIPSPASGVLGEILAAEGSVVKVGALLAIIAAPGESPAAHTSVQPAAVAAPAVAAPASTTQAFAASPASPAIPGTSRELGFISPVVAKIAAEHGVSLSQVTGTGLNGRITKKDLLTYLEGKPATQPPGPAAVLAAQPPFQQLPTQAQGGDQLIPHSTVRRSIAEHMLLSKRTSAHVTTIMEVDLSRVIAHRQANKDLFARDGVNLTFTAYFAAAAVAALKAYPVVNSSWSNEGLLLHREINLGMATSLGEAGLIVPVIKNADGLSLLGLARAVNDLANRARSRQLKPDEVKGGTFTITNHGISGSLFATPIINQPQCGILGVGIIQKRPVVIETPQGDSLGIRPMVYLGLTFDHRILDGASADNFLGKIVATLGEWAK